MKRTAVFSAALVAALLAGCHSAPPSQSSQPQPNTTSTGAKSKFQVFKMRGKVVSTNAATGEVTVAAGAIPGFMEAMTMPYKVKDPNVLSELHTGDTITADVDAWSNGDMLLDHIVVVAQARPDYRPTSNYHVPAPGDPVPDFKLINQDGRPIHLSQFRGRRLLVTFIYTRCPLPNFCPLVTRNFANLNQRIAADPALSAKTHLVSITFDPENDTPARLRAYGAQYIGSSAKDAFAHWDFGVPDKATLAKMALFFDLGLTPEADQTITHTLATTLIGADGKVIQFYPGNDWTVDQVFADLKRA